MRKNKKGFTLIELVAVLVILAIIALIVTPLVMNIIKKDESLYIKTRFHILETGFLYT